MKIDRAEAKRIAQLAHLEFDDAGLDRMAAEMTAILEYIDQLREVEVHPSASDVPVTATPLREDVVQPSIERDLAEKNAPQWREGHFVVPKVIGE